jgi:hypothetical protein
VTLLQSKLLSERSPRVASGHRHIMRPGRSSRGRGGVRVDRSWRDNGPLVGKSHQLRPTRPCRRRHHWTVRDVNFVPWRHSHAPKGPTVCEPTSIGPLGTCK